MPPWTRQLILPGLALLSLVGLMSWGKLSPLFAPTTSEIQHLPVPSCDLNQGACQVALPKAASLNFSITPHPMPTLKPLALHLDLRGVTAQSVSVDFLGADMEMGLNQTTLQPTPSLTNTGQHFTGTSSLPICVTGAMKWRADVQITQQDGTRWLVPFEFTSGGHE